MKRLIAFFLTSLFFTTAFCQTSKNISKMQTIQFIPEEFHDVKLGHYESSANNCTPHYPYFEFQLLNEIAINAPEKIIFNFSNGDIIPVIPICGAYIITLRRGAKYAHLSTQMIHIRKIDEGTVYSGGIIDKNLEYEHPALPPDHLQQQEERARRIEEAQKYSDKELDEGQASGSAMNINLLEYVDMPLTPGSYEIWLSFNGLESNRVIVEIVFQGNSTLNEKWTANYTMEEPKPQKTGAIEIEFRPDGTFRYDEWHPDEERSYANGTYHYQEKTGEIFVHVESGGYDWVTRPATETTPPLYWGEVYSNYQLYFKITKRSYSTVTVIEHINSNHEGVSNTAIWKENNGSYSLIAIDQNMMKEKQYTVSFSI